MRICYICTGGFTHTLPYVNYFKSAGHDVHLITLSPGPDWGVSTYNVGFGKIYSRTRGKWKYPMSILRARRLIRKLKPDVVHAHFATSGGLTALVCGFHPTLTTIHGSDLHLGMKSSVWRFLLKRIFDFSDCVNACTEDQKRTVISLGIEADKIRVLTLGVDTDQYAFVARKPMDESGPLKLITTRQLEPLYDHPVVIKALTIVRSKGIDFQMTFVGEGSVTEELKAMVNEEGLADCVRFLGQTDKSEVIRHLRENDIFLSSPKWDGISIALLEAMAMGLFPVVSDIEVYHDWVQDGVGCYMHKVGSSHSLAECIMKVLGNPELVASGTRRNREKVVELADTKTNMKQLENIYKYLIKNRV